MTDFLTRRTTMVDTQIRPADVTKFPIIDAMLQVRREVFVPADQTPTDALAAAGIHVDVKCSDGICGVCKCGVVSGEVEHRDFVLGPKERATSMMLCSSRAVEPDGVVEIDL